MFDVIALGDSCRDIFLQMEEETAHVYCELNKDECELCFHYADKIPVGGKFETIGGNAANAAVSCARLGLKTALYTHVGDDRTGTQIISELKEAGVADNYFVRDHHEETNYNTVITLGGERTILVYHRDRHYSLPHMDAAKWIYITSMKSGYEKVLPSILEYAHRTKAKICFQPGTYQLKQQGKEVAELLKHTELFFVNRDEAARYLKVSGETPIEDLLKGLRNLGIKIAVITHGAKGAFAQDSKGSYFLGTLTEVKRVEVTGAGDAFASATTAALCSGLELPDALTWGLMQASAVIQKVGAQEGLLTRSELDEYLQTYNQVRAIPLTNYKEEA